MSAIINTNQSDITTFEIPEPDYSDSEDDTSDSKHPLSSSVSDNKKGQSKLEDMCLPEIPEPDYSDCEDDASQPKHTVRSPDDRSEQATSELHSLNSGRRNEENIWTGTVSEFDIPEPDYSSDEDDGETNTRARLTSTDSKPSDSEVLVGPVIQPAHSYIAVDPVLIEAKKLHKTPVLTKDQKNLQKELQLKQKLGIMLEKKPELQKVMDNRNFKNKKEMHANNQESKHAELKTKLGEQAKKVLQVDTQDQKKSSNASENKKEIQEFLQVHSKIHKSKT